MKHAAMLLVLIGVAGCLGPRELTPVNRYTLQPQVNVETVTGQPKTLGVRPIEIASSYTFVMAHLDEGLQLAYWPYQEWAENPADAFTRLLQDAIARTNAFQDSGNAAEMARPDYYLTGTIRKFHARESAEGPVAEIEVLLEVREARGTAKLWDALLHQERPMARFDGPSLAVAMNEAMALVVEEAARQIGAAAQGITP